MMRWLFHKHGPDEPCPHMESTLNRMAEGRAHWLARLYAVAHTARCTPCRKFLHKLEKTLIALKASKAPEPDPDVVQRLMSKLDGP